MFNWLLQVLRYDRGGDPLWISDEHIPSVKDVPGCCCGAKRQFEFQVSKHSKIKNFCFVLYLYILLYVFYLSCAKKQETYSYKV